MYPPSDIDKVRARGDTLPVDPEMREAFDRLGADLRTEIRSGDAATLAAVNQLGVELRGEMQAQGMELRGEMQVQGAELRGEIQTSAAGVLQQMLQQMGEFESRMRRHFDVAAESVRAESRFVVEGTALLSQRMDRRDSEDAERHGGLEGRVVKLEVRVKSLEDKQKSRRRPR
jgi:hypothetical protein